MEKVKTLKDIPGFLEKGDVLTSEAEGENFELTIKDDLGERGVSIDYYTVCGNIPIFFDWVFEGDVFEKESYKVVRSEEEIAERAQFFQDNIGPYSGQEKNVVFNNLLWFIDWLTGKAELLK